MVYEKNTAQAPEVTIVKRDGSEEPYSPEKVWLKIDRCGREAMSPLTSSQKSKAVGAVNEALAQVPSGKVTEDELDAEVAEALDEVSPAAAAWLRGFRGKEERFAQMMGAIYADVERCLMFGDKENANRDASLTSTKKALTAAATYKQIYSAQFLTPSERKLVEDGDIYIHDMSDRLTAINCCLFRMDRVLSGGFEMANVWYNEPNSLRTAFAVVADVVLSAASQQYGGFTIPQVDKLLAPYAEKSYASYYEELKGYGLSDEEADAKAAEKVERDYEQGFQSWEYKFNTVSSSRGDYPFITVTAGLDGSRFGRMGNKAMFRVHREGQGKDGFKKPVLFPKYVFLYDEELHGNGRPLHDVYEEGIRCSTETMYPDWLSLTGEGYVPSMYKQYKAVVSPMGCRAFLSPYYERGGQGGPADAKDAPVFEGRFNSGAISLNLPLIYLRSVVEKRNFYDVLDERLEAIREIHKRTRDYIGELRASTNPLAFECGGFYGGNLRPDQKLKESPKLMDSTTYSFGITALDELQHVHNGKSLAQDGEFALEVMEYINQRAEDFKREDHMLYAIYGTPAENLCGKQVEQIRAYVKRNCDALTAAGYEVVESKGEKVIPGVCDRKYVSNSFHCNVREDISPIAKQDLEARFWNYHNGGKIQYVRYPVGYNRDSVNALVQRAMKLGFYEGVNMSKAYCNDCGHEEDGMEVCPCCGSSNLTKIDRMNGYLAYSRVQGDTRLNEAKMEEIADRVSM